MVTPGASMPTRSNPSVLNHPPAPANRASSTSLLNTGANRAPSTSIVSTPGRGGRGRYSTAAMKALKSSETDMVPALNPAATSARGRTAGSRRRRT